MFTNLAKWVTGHPKKIISFWVLVLLAGAYFAINLPNILSSGGFNDPKSESMVQKKVLEKEFTNKYPQNLVVVVHHKSKKVSDSDYEDMVKKIKNTLTDINKVKMVSTYYDDGNKQFISDDGSTTFLTVGLEATEDQAASLVPSIESKINDMKKGIFDVKVTGGPALNYALNNATKESVSKAEMIAIPVMIIVLLLVFRTLVSASLPLIMAMFALTGTMATVYLIARHFPQNILITNIISMVGLGVAVDYSLFIVSRFRQELEHLSVTQAVTKTMETAGRSVLFSGITVAISLSALFIPNIMIFNSVALGGVIVVFFSILVSLTMLPALLTLLGKRVNKGKLPFYKNERRGSLWVAVSRKILKHPVFFLIPSLLIIVFVAWPSIKINMQVPVASATTIPSDAPERQGFELLTSKFTQGDIFPIQIVLKSEGSSIFTHKNLVTVDKITKKISKLNHIEKVTSITNWNRKWDLLNYEQAYRQFNVLPHDVTSQLKNLINVDKDNHTTIILVSSKYAADSKAAHELVTNIRDIISQNNSANLTSYVGGETATGVDFDHKVFQYLPLMISMVFLISFVVLAITFKSIIIPIKAIVLNALVTLSSIGVLAFVFQNNFSWNFNSDQTINSITPVVLFTVLFGLSMDYEVIIINRMKEFYDGGTTHDLSIIKGISDTAGLVNGAAVIMITVFGAFALVNVRVVAEMGLGLAFAIFMDALLIRTILIPVLMKLFGEINWWWPIKNIKPNRKSRLYKRESSL